MNHKNQGFFSSLKYQVLSRRQYSNHELKVHTILSKAHAFNHKQNYTKLSGSKPLNAVKIVQFLKVGF